MRPPHRILNRNQVHRRAAEHLQPPLKFKDSKRKGSAQVLGSLRLAAAARITSLSDACQRRDPVPADETACKALRAPLPDSAGLQRQLNAASAGHRPKTRRQQLPRWAIDLTLIPSPGQPFRDPEEIYRGQAKDGTRPFPAHATAYVVKPGPRDTVAWTGVTTGESLKDVVRRRLRPAAGGGVRPRLLLLDRGFDRGAVVRYLPAARHPFLMPVVCHGRSPKQPGGPTGSSVFRTWKKSGWSRPTRADARQRTATVSIGVKCRNCRGERKRHGRQALISASGGDRPPSPDAVFTTYRLRFGIESSSCPLHAAWLRTTTRRPVVRLLYVGITLVLRNLWVWLHSPILSMPRRGGRVIWLERRRWETLLLWLLHVVEEAFGVADVTYTERDVEDELAM